MIKKISIALLCMTLFACADNEHEDLQQWMRDQAKNARGNVAPLPQVMPYEPVAFDVGKQSLDPFNPARAGNLKPKGESKDDPNLNPRQREPLEAYELESLKYVGIITKNKNSFAIILADGALYQVKPGQYMGQNFGVITQITEAEVALKELVQDSNGDWVERIGSLLLQEQGGKK